MYYFLICDKYKCAFAICVKMVDIKWSNHLRTFSGFRFIILIILVYSSKMFKIVNIDL